MQNLPDKLSILGTLTQNILQTRYGKWGVWWHAFGVWTHTEDSWNHWQISNKEIQNDLVPDKDIRIVNKTRELIFCSFCLNQFSGEIYFSRFLQCSLFMCFVSIMRLQCSYVIVHHRRKQYQFLYCYQKERLINFGHYKPVMYKCTLSLL